LSTVALGGCTSGPRPAASPLASAHPITSPTSARPALADIVLTPDALGDIRIARPVPTTTDLVVYNPSLCVSPEMNIKAGDPDAGSWAANYPNQQNDNAPSSPFVVVTAGQKRDGDVSTVWVWSPGVHTSTGIEVGSTVAQLTADYPRFDATLHGPLSDVYVVNGKVGFLEIEVARSDSNDAGYWAPDQAGTVLWMGSIAPGGTAAAIAGTDVGPSPCPNTVG
jgi:hypothetical protein